MIERARDRSTRADAAEPLEEIDQLAPIAIGQRLERRLEGFLAQRAQQWIVERGHRRNPGEPELDAQRRGEAEEEAVEGRDHDAIERRAQSSERALGLAALEHGTTELAAQSFRLARIRRRAGQPREDPPEDLPRRLAREGGGHDRVGLAAGEEDLEIAQRQAMRLARAGRGADDAMRMRDRAPLVSSDCDASAASPSRALAAARGIRHGRPQKTGTVGKRIPGDSFESVRVGRRIAGRPERRARIARTTSRATSCASARSTASHPASASGSALRRWPRFTKPSPSALLAPTRAGVLAQHQLVERELQIDPSSLLAFPGPVRLLRVIDCSALL